MTGTNLPPTNTDYVFDTNAGTPFTGTVATNAVDPEAGAMVYGLVPLYGPYNGSVALAGNGAFTYTPAPGFVGVDTFRFTTSDGTNSVTRSVAMRVGTPGAVVAFANSQNIIRVPAARINVVSPIIEFPVEVAPEAVVGDIYRMTIRQAAMGCDDQVYYHASCFDITITRC